MKATGIVRRIDDLGRVVIPKEIRRTLRLREGSRTSFVTSAACKPVAEAAGGESVSNDTRRFFLSL